MNRIAIASLALALAAPALAQAAAEKTRVNSWLASRRKRKARIQRDAGDPAPAACNSHPCAQRLLFAVLSRIIRRSSG